MESVIVCIANINWSFTWQRHQEFMTQLAARGYRILFIENTRSRSPSVTDIRKVSVSKGVESHRERQPVNNIEIIKPHTLPFPNTAVISSMNARAIKSKIYDYVEETDEVWVWVYLPTRFSVELIQLLRPKRVIYDCVSNFEALSNGKKLHKYESRIFSLSDLVIVDSDSLMAKHKESHQNIRRIPTGIPKQFLQASQSHPLVRRERSTPYYIGYFGAISRWIDLKLIKSVAINNPDFQFVFVGPVNTDTSLLNKLSNVRFMGPKEISELPLLMSSMHANIIPYAVNDFTNYVLPAKLGQYLMVPTPIVTTKTLELSRYSDVIDIADTPESFANQIRESSQKPIDWGKRQSVLKELQWESINACLSEAVKP